MVFRRSHAAAALALCLLHAASPRAAAQVSHTETFANTLHADAAATSALWDTVQTTLRLQPRPVTLAGTLPTLDRYHNVAVSGDYAYVSAFAAGLLIVDISDPGNPVQVDSVFTFEQVNDLDLAGNYAFLANIFDGLCVVDITDPTNAAKVAIGQTLGQTLGVDVQGDYAYLADGPRGLIVMDVSDPLDPTVVGGLDSPGYAHQVRVSGNHAYLVDWQEGLQVYDITNPLSPAIVGSLDTPGSARALAVSGDVAYVGDSNFGLQVIDVSDPSHPVLMSTVDTPGLARGVRTDGAHAYVADHDQGLVVIDIRDPYRPIKLQEVGKAVYCYGLDVRGRWLYTADHMGGLHIMNIADIVSPPEAADDAALIGSGGFDVSGSRAFVARASGGMSVVDVGDPWNLQVGGDYVTSFWSQDVAVDGNAAFIANFANPTFEAVDITNPYAPVSAGTASPLDYCNAVVVDGDIAYVTGWKYSNGAGLAAVDVTDIGAPSVLGYAPVQAAQDLRVRGNTAIVRFDASDVPTGIALVDISDPQNPAIGGTYEVTGTQARSLTVDGERAYIGFDTGVHVVDVRNTGSPFQVGEIPVSGATAIAIAGDVAVLAAGGVVHAYNIADITSPLDLGTVPLGGDPRDVRVIGDYAILASSAGITTTRIFNRDGVASANTGVSLVVSEQPDAILRARMTSAIHGQVGFAVRASESAAWQPIVADGAWNRIDEPGNTMRWRADLVYDPTQDSAEPRVDSLVVDWLYAYPVIMEVADVPDDQGWRVWVQWQRSGYDFPDSPEPVMSYTLFRRGASGWDSVATILPIADDFYAAAVATDGNDTEAGTIYSAYRVRAHTSGASYTSSPDSGFSVDNLAPDPPPTVWVGYAPGGNQVSWRPSLARDVVAYRVYRDADPSFIPSLTNLVHTGSGTSWTDPGGGPTDVYKVAALDARPNESDATGQTTVTAVGDQALDRSALFQNVPNPFNPSTTIRYVVAAPGARVSLRVYDVRGALVRTLVDGERSAGEHGATWDGVTNAGSRAASGVYFYRLKAGEFEQTRKMIMVQ